MSDIGMGIQSNGNNIVRIALSMGVAVFVTFGLFMVMVQLVKFSDEVRLDEGPTFRLVDVVEDIVDTPPQRASREVEKPPEVEAPPPEVDVPDEVIDNPNAINVTIGPANLGETAGVEGIKLGPSQDGDYLPLVRVQPDYPRRAAERGVTGYVVVELTVAVDGTVPPDSIVVLEAEPKGYFERSAINAAKKFKYKPKIVNGEPQEVTGVTYQFTFNLEDADGRRR